MRNINLTLNVLPREELERLLLLIYQELRDWSDDDTLIDASDLIDSLQLIFINNGLPLTESENE